MASLRKRILDMSVGESLVIPLADYGYSTVRSYASDLGFFMERRYTAERDRENRTYTITRKA